MTEHGVLKWQRFMPLPSSLDGYLPFYVITSKSYNKEASFISKKERKTAYFYHIEQICTCAKQLCVLLLIRNKYALYKTYKRYCVQGENMDELLKNYPVLLSIADVADILNVTPATVRRHVNCNDLPHIKIGRLVRIPKDSLIACLHGNQISTRKEEIR